MIDKWNCESYDSGYCYSLGRPLTDEEDDMCSYCCCQIKLYNEDDCVEEQR